jgi:hypothetical protein
VSTVPLDIEAIKARVRRIPQPLTSIGPATLYALLNIDIPALIAEVERLRARAETLRSQRDSARLLAEDLQEEIQRLRQQIESGDSPRVSWEVLSGVHAALKSMRDDARGHPRGRLAGGLLEDIERAADLAITRLLAAIQIDSRGDSGETQGVRRCPDCDGPMLTENGKERGFFHKLDCPSRRARDHR